jgi:hypothetical protein
MLLTVLCQMIDIEQCQLLVRGQDEQSLTPHYRTQSVEHQLVSQCIYTVYTL